jgi:hypothetical protein
VRRVRHQGDPGVRGVRHDDQLGGRDGVVGGADHGPGRDRLPGRDAGLLGQRDRRQRLLRGRERFGFAAGQADSSSWSAVIERLQADGYNVTAFGLDEGESIGGLLAQGTPAPALAHLDIDARGFAWLLEDDFVNHFAADVDPVQARVMYAVQQPMAASTLQDVMGVPAWKSHPSWFLVAAGDQAIPPDDERQFAKRMGATTVEVPATTSRWSPTPMTWCSSSRRLPKLFRPPINLLHGTDRSRGAGRLVSRGPRR